MRGIEKSILSHCTDCESTALVTIESTPNRSTRRKALSCRSVSLDDIRIRLDPTGSDQIEAVGHRREYGCRGRPDRGRMPGRLMISECPLVPAVWRDGWPSACWSRLTRRSSSPKPGSSLISTARMASGVSSRAAGPVPPVVRIRSKRCWSQRSISSSRTEHESHRDDPLRQLVRRRDRARQPCLDQWTR